MRHTLIHLPRFLAIKQDISETGDESISEVSEVKQKVWQNLLIVW